MACTSCGHPIGHDDRFCPQCGASQVVTGEERRIVTVLFADVVGFTSLAERMDPEEVKHLIDRAFERLARDITAFGGVVDKILGDGIIALFGAPIAHEDDAERAVRAGLRMQQTVESLAGDSRPSISMRIGINTGEVLVGNAPAGGEYTAMGDVVNSADRLQGLAEPGQTLVGEATRQATGEAISYHAAGRLPARGREEPLEAWIALGAAHPPGLHRLRGTIFVGRGHEMDLLAAQARLAVDGSRAQLSVVVGEAGIGKTRLVNEAAGYLATQFGATVLEGRCLPYGEANVWWPVADLVRDLFHLSVDAPMAEAEIGVRKSLFAHLDDPLDADVDRYTTALLHAFGYDTTLRGGDRNRNRSEVMLAFTTLLATELQRAPVVLLLSDMQWAGAAVWGLVGHLLTELGRERLSIIVTTRPAEGDQLPRGRHGLAVIQLGPLGHAASAELLADLGLDLGDRKINDLVARSGGNPFFLEELAGLVAGHGASAGHEDSDFDIELDELPATLRGIIGARLDALDVGERALIEDAAVLGRTGPIEGLVMLARHSRGALDIEQDLAGLVEKDLLVLDGSRYRFRSDLIRDVTYGRLTKTVRAQQHHGIATYLESIQGDTVRNSVVVAIAEHYWAAVQIAFELSNVPGIDRDQVKERTLYWLAQAGERALDVGEPRQASRWYDFGIDLAEETDALAGFLFGRAKARTETHDIPGARADLDRLDSLEGTDRALAAKALLVRGDVDRKAGDLEQAAARLGEAADLLAELDDPAQQALALRLLGMTEMARSDDVAARHALEASRSVAMAAGDRRGEGWALQSLAWHAFRLGLVEEARVMVKEAIGIFTEVDDRGALVWARGILAWVAYHSGDWNEARTLIDTVLPETRRRGDPWAEGITLNLDASLQLWSGRAQESYNLARQARAVGEQLDDVTLSVMSRTIEGRALVSLGRIDEGTKVLDEAFFIADQADDRESRRLAVISNCASAARLGEPERAIRWAARYDGVNDDPTVVGETDLVVSLALAMFQRGALTEAAAQLGLDERDEHDEGVGQFADAVGSLVAAALGDVATSEELSRRSLLGSSTYLDRVFALIARAAVRARSLDTVGCDEALAAARVELEPTDDQLTRHLVDLAAAEFGRSSIPEAEARMSSAGMDPSGWALAFGLAARSAPSGPGPSQ